MTSAPDDGPLRGLRVLDLTRFPPGAYCTLLLADLGADVVRVVPPSRAETVDLVVGEVGLSRGKRSMTLDLRAPGAHEVLARLVRAVDVVVENSPPGSMEARGFGYRQAAEANPALIWCSITGYGQDGPYASWAGHDPSYLAQSGLLGVLSPELPWHPGAMISVPLGASMAALGIAAAVVERDRTGAGRQVDISLAESTTWVLAGQGWSLGERSTGIPPSPGRRLYACADGEFVSVAAAEPRTWAALCTGLGLDDLAGDPYPQDAEAVTGRIAAVFATRPMREWIDLLGPAGAAVAPVNRGRAVVDDPQTQARGTFVEVAGTQVPVSPVRLRDVDGPRSAPATAEPPRGGQHTDEVLTAAGFTAEELRGLRGSGVI
ncbi:CaiB/BaiF CoA-transferase family protein [Blastococcus sp. URHD0036]|uniref:CaiB/BaiF CoA transferase family protein n=1 Tax=Blastococcus sp. URHD0036 TaxID=1380356 RepID=UPI0004969F86|nr:CaiB/BaiF CoA-transferase family protein [Blastococcus sp. URHD0036]